MSNFMGAYPDVDKTLTQDGCPADAKAVGDITANIKTDVSSKINLAVNIGYCHQTETCDCDLSDFEDGEYLLIAPRSSFVSTFSINGGAILSYDSNLSNSGKILTVKNLQWYTVVFVIKIK